eukprot:GEMP01037312.1.p1 GENE.GEMP01037312.1~~GEMP01037312.1.p1  ORF type:complete len:429 (-),score=83.29 GEMP01037312.1:418-1704(-)
MVEFADFEFGTMANAAFSPTMSPFARELEFPAFGDDRDKDVKVSCKNTFLHFAELKKNGIPPSPMRQFSKRRCFSDVTDAQALFVPSPMIGAAASPSMTVGGSPTLLPVDEAACGEFTLPPCEFILPPCEFATIQNDTEIDFCHDVMGVQMAHAVFGTEDDSETNGTRQHVDSGDATDSYYSWHQRGSYAESNAPGGWHCNDEWAQNRVSFTAPNENSLDESQLERKTQSKKRKDKRADRPERNAEDKQKGDTKSQIDVKLPKGCTTVMLRNIPNKYTRQMLIHILNKRFAGQYDFMYLPIDFKNKCNVGYGFINFRTPETCHLFIRHFHGIEVRKSLPGFNSKKVCEVTPARVQGLIDNVRRLQNSPVMGQLKDHPEWLPVLFDANGNCEPFPCPEQPAKARSASDVTGIKPRKEKERRWEGRQVLA